LIYLYGAVYCHWEVIPVGFWPKWTYSDKAKPEDPLNIVFEGAALQDVRTFLVSKRWSSNVWPAFDQFIPNPDLLNLKIQDLQMQHGDIMKRVHARFWDMGSIIVANVHHEVAGIPQHIVLDYHAAEMFLASMFENESLKTKALGR
jgi:hypothetical protein